MFTPRIIVKKRFQISDMHVEYVADEWKPPEEYEALVEEEWRKRMAFYTEQNQKIWDGTYYRVLNVADLEAGAMCIMRLGTIRYRYIATHLELDSKFESFRLPPLNHLSTAAMLQSSDGEYLFGKRSINETIDLIGGGVQPDEITVLSGSDIRANVLKEVFEETGISAPHIANIEEIGITFSRHSNIVVISHIDLSVSRAEIEKIFESRQDNEMKEPYFVPHKGLHAFLRTTRSYRPLISELMS